jgi:hypothetical protein
MQVQFVAKEHGPERLICEAELVFDEDSPLVGMKLVGFSLWRGVDGEVFVTFPARAFGAGADRRFFDLLRPAESGAPDVARRVKAWLREQYEARRAA